MNAWLMVLLVVLLFEIAIGVFSVLTLDFWQRVIAAPWWAQSAGGVALVLACVFFVGVGLTHPKNKDDLKQGASASTFGEQSPIIIGDNAHVSYEAKLSDDDVEKIATRLKVMLSESHEKFAGDLNKEYPVGYSLVAVTKDNRSETSEYMGTEKVRIDWSQAKVEQIGDDIAITFPAVTAGFNARFASNRFLVPRKVGAQSPTLNFMGVSLSGKIVSIRDGVVVAAIGVKHLNN